uniref:Metabotropic glutamate receptor 1 n=1 Tax=Rhipicephalus zambeziensis TaxID=60191 RepID=A0A224Z1L8_9ACAR
MGKDVHSRQPNLNEMAHDRARELTRRDDQSATGELGPDIQFNDPLLTYHEITSHYRFGRSQYPIPHTKLERAQAVAFRMLQTRSYPSRARLSLYNSDITPQCPDCAEVNCTLSHMLWQCPALPQGPLTSESDWEEALRSSELHHQLKAVQRAQELAERLHVPAPTRASPTVAAARVSFMDRPAA